MNELTVFNFNDNEVRTIFKDGEVWFVAKDVCEILEIKNSRMALSRLDEDEKGVSLIDTPGGTQKMSTVNKFGLYSLVLSSRKPEAKQFKRWITHEVIPSIEKHGAYMTPDTIEKVLLNPDFVIQLATRLKEEQEEKERLKSKLIEAKPKLETYEQFMNGQNHMKIGHLAKMLGIGQNKLFKVLREMRVLQSTESDWNIPYQTYIDRGYFEVITKPIRQWYGYKNQPITLVTPKGAEWISKKLKESRSNKVIEFTG